MSSLEIVVILGVAIAISAVAAPRLRIAAPLVLVAVGLLLGFVPDLREIHLPSEAVLILFLPVLLFWESITTSLRSIRRDLRGVLLTSTVLVVATAFAVAGVGVTMGMSSILVRGIEEDVLPTTERYGMGTLSYRPSPAAGCPAGGAPGTAPPRRRPPAPARGSICRAPPTSASSRPSSSSRCSRRTQGSRSPRWRSRSWSTTRA